MKRVFNILFWIVIVSALTVAIYYVTARQKNVMVKELSINIQYIGSDIFLSKKDIKSIISGVAGDIFEKKISSLDFEKIESTICQNPYVANVNVFSDLNGKISVELMQRQPIARILTNKGSFYIDQYGEILPLNEKYISRVMLVNGIIKNYSYEKIKGINICEIEGENELKDIYYLVNFIHQNKFLNALTEQIYITRNKEFEIVPKIGKQIVLLGNAANLDLKFRKLYLFYKYGIKQSGWDKYKSINLKFKNQVVCTKRK
jgi:cell division protein FtsQ